MYRFIAQFEWKEEKRFWNLLLIQLWSIARKRYYPFSVVQDRITTEEVFCPDDNNLMNVIKNEWIKIKNEVLKYSFVSVEKCLRCGDFAFHIEKKITFDFWLENIWLWTPNMIQLHQYAQFTMFAFGSLTNVDIT